MFAAKHANTPKLKKPKKKKVKALNKLPSPDPKPTDLAGNPEKKRCVPEQGNPCHGSWFDIEPPATGGRFASTLVSEIEARSIVWATSTDVCGGARNQRRRDGRGGRLLPLSRNKDDGELSGSGPPVFYDAVSWEVRRVRGKLSFLLFAFIFRHVNGRLVSHFLEVRSTYTYGVSTGNRG